MRSLFAAPLLLCRAFLAAYGDCGEDGGSDGQEQEQDG